MLSAALWTLWIRISKLRDSLKDTQLKGGGAGVQIQASLILCLPTEPSILLGTWWLSSKCSMNMWTMNEWMNGLMGGWWCPQWQMQYLQIVEQKGKQERWTKIVNEHYKVSKRLVTKSLWYAKCFYLQVIFKQKEPFIYTRVFPTFKQSTRRWTHFKDALCQKCFCIPFFGIRVCCVFPPSMSNRGETLSSSGEGPDAFWAEAGAYLRDHAAWTLWFWVGDWL